ncbi:MAG: TIGR03619 family F420-dependent LLM class oxidoreductase [Microthrixaceae bacterium]
MSGPPTVGAADGPTGGGLSFGLTVPDALAADWPRWSATGGLGRIARDVEDAGFDAVSVTDHPLPPARWLRHGGHHSLDPFVALATFAAATTRLRLLTNVLVLPYRNAATTAKALATLDAVSDGRLVVGAAVGYLQAEFEVVDADFAARAATFESTLTSMRRVWAGEVADHEARPSPSRSSGIPVWVGGNSGAARRRAATLAEGWMPFQQDPTMATVTGTAPLDDGEVLAAAIGDVHRRRTEAGRTGPFDVCFAPGHDSALLRSDASADEVDETVERLVGAGVTWISIPSRAADHGALLAELDFYSARLLRDRRR